MPERASTYGGRASHYEGFAEEHRCTGCGAMICTVECVVCDAIDEPPAQAIPDRPLPKPTRALPGTSNKVEVLAQRAKAGLNLWHPDDPVLEHKPAEELVSIEWATGWRRRKRHDGESVYNGGFWNPRLMDSKGHPNDRPNRKAG